jgi:hypothetical protein
MMFRPKYHVGDNRLEPVYGRKSNSKPFGNTDFRPNTGDSNRWVKKGYPPEISLLLMKIPNNNIEWNFQLVFSVVNKFRSLFIFAQSG